MRSRQDRIAVMDGGRVLQQGTASELAAAPATAFVADFSGAVVLTGHARGGDGGVTVVGLDGGGEVTALEGEPGPVAVSVYPWEIALARPGEAARDSARNHLDVEVVSVTTVAPQPLTAELSDPSARELGLVPGSRRRLVQGGGHMRAAALSPAADARCERAQNRVGTGRTYDPREAR